MDSETFDPKNAAERERIRVELDESALALQRDRVAAETTGAGKAPSLQERIEALGFHDEAARIFDLLPLVHVAWADGTIEDGERGLILDVLQIRSMAKGRAFTTLEALLEKKPSQAYLDESLAVLRDIVASDPEQSKTIVGLCIKVAEAAGGFLGIRPVSKDERAMIERVASELGDEAVAEFKRRLG